MTQQILNFLFDFFTFLTVLIKGVQLQLETRYFDTVKSILKQMQCRIWFNKKPKSTSDGFWTPVSQLYIYGHV